MTSEYIRLSNTSQDPRGFASSEAFVDAGSSQDARKAVEELNGRFLLGNRITVALACPEPRLEEPPDLKSRGPLKSGANTIALEKIRKFGENVSDHLPPSNRSTEALARPEPTFESPPAVGPLKSGANTIPLQKIRKFGENKFQAGSPLPTPADDRPDQSGLDLVKFVPKQEENYGSTRNVRMNHPTARIPTVSRATVLPPSPFASMPQSSAIGFGYRHPTRWAALDPNTISREAIPTIGPAPTQAAGVDQGWGPWFDVKPGRIAEVGDFKPPDGMSTGDKPSSISNDDKKDAPVTISIPKTEPSLFPKIPGLTMDLSDGSTSPSARIVEVQSELHSLQGLSLPPSSPYRSNRLTTRQHAYGSAEAHDGANWASGVSLTSTNDRIDDDDEIL